MLLLLVLTGLAGLWWLGRNEGRLPAGLTPRRLAGYAAFAVALVFVLRGALPAAAALGLLGLWLQGGLETLMGRLRRLGEAFGPRRPRPTASAVVFEADGGDGAVRGGPGAGRRLSALSPAELGRLHAWMRAADPAGLRQLEAYLDRRNPGWRVDADRDFDARTRGPLQPGPMTQEEAYQVLGLERGASLEQVRTAHRALMKRLHPDQGGSAERAARVNAARDRLTDRHR